MEYFSTTYICLQLGAAFLLTIIFGRVMDKLNPLRVLMVGFIIGALTLAVFGLTVGGSFSVIVAFFVTSYAFMYGSSAGLLAIATTFYPAGIRASGIGWAYAVSRIGLMLVPVVLGSLYGRNFNVSQICVYQALIALFVAFTLMVLHSGLKRQAAFEALIEFPNSDDVARIPPVNNKTDQAPLKSSRLPFGFVFVTAAIFILFTWWHGLGQTGGFILIIGAIIGAWSLASLLTKK